MKKILVHIILPLTAIIITSCTNKIKHQPITKIGLEKIEKNIKTKFGTNAYFTSLNLTHNKGEGNTINVRVTKNPDLLKLEEWNNINDEWIQDSEIHFEIPTNSNAKEFMFQLDKEINFKRISELIEQSKKSIEKELGDQNLAITLTNTFIKFPKNGNIENTEFIINLKIVNNNKNYSFNYPLYKG